MIWAFLKGLSPTTWLMGGMGIVIITLGIILGFKQIQVNYLIEDKKAVELKVVNLQTEKRLLEQSIERQNDAIDNLANKTKDMQNAMDKLNIALKKSDSDLKTTIENIGNKPIPKDCAGAFRELSSFSVKFANDWNKK